MNKKNIGLLVLCFFSITSIAQNIIITDMELNPLAGVKISSLNNNLTESTNSIGVANVQKFEKSTDILISLANYVPVTMSYDDLKKRNFKVYLNEKIRDFNTVVVSANKFEEKAKNIAQQFDVISKKELAFMSQQTTADVMQNTGNILVQKSQQGGGSPIIRGFETNKVLMVVDGVRMNNAIYRGGHLQNILTLDNAAMEKIEVLFGPGSVMYGSDALGGVMHFYTKNPMLSSGPELRVKSNAMLRYNSANSGQTIHADVSIGSLKFGSFTSLTYSAFGDLKQGENRNTMYGDFGLRPWSVDRINGVDSLISNPNALIQKGSGYSQYDLMQKFLFKQNDRISHTLNVQYSSSTDIPRYDRLTQTSGNSPKYAEWYYGPQKRLLSAYTMNLNKNMGWYSNGRITVAYQNIEESRNDRKFRNNSLNHRIEKLDIVTANADFSKKLLQHEFHYGVDAWTNSVNSKARKENIITGNVQSLDTRYPDGGSTMSSAAIYLGHTYKINDKWVLNDGLRLSAVNISAKFNDTTFFPFPVNGIEQNNLAVNGNLGLIFRPTKEWKLSVLASSGFRAPNVDDLSKVFESVPGSVIVPNPNLKPEYTYNLDLNASRMWNDKLTLSATGFYTWYRNAITTKTSTFNGQDSIIYSGQLSQVISSVNASEAYLYGANFSLSAQITSSLSFTHTTNYTFGRITSGTEEIPLDHIAPTFGKTSVMYQKEKLKTEFFVLYNGAKKTKDYNPYGEDNQAFSADPINGYMPAWLTLNARLGYQVGKNVQLMGAIENITDLNYRVFASNISASGRSFSLTIRGLF